ncbi:MAG: hypothetical protein ABMA14_06990 [Hyphomonadaceae bacterium]
MRFVGVEALVLALAACEPVQAADAPAEPAKSVMQTEAEKACAGMTGYSPEKLQGKSVETQALMRREYDLCVKSVAADEGGVAKTPALRGRTTAP